MTTQSIGPAVALEGRGIGKVFGRGELATRACDGFGLDSGQ